MAEFLVCRWCAEPWNSNAAESFAAHEGRCPLSIECPRCGSAVRVGCHYPGGQSIVRASHSQREKMARAKSEKPPRVSTAELLAILDDQTATSPPTSPLIGEDPK